MDLPYLYPDSSLLARSSKLRIMLVEFQKLGSQKKCKKTNNFSGELTKGSHFIQKSQLFCLIWGYGSLSKRIYNPITAMEFLAMFTIQLYHTKS